MMNYMHDAGNGLLRIAAQRWIIHEALNIKTYNTVQNHNAPVKFLRQ